MSRRFRICVPKGVFETTNWVARPIWFLYPIRLKMDQIGLTMDQIGLTIDQTGLRIEYKGLKKSVIGPKIPVFL